MKNLVSAVFAAGLALSAASTVWVADAAAADAPAPKWSSDSNLGELLDNPATKAVLVKEVPTVVADPQIDMGRSGSLRAIQQYVPILTDAKLKEIDAELAKIH